LREYNATRKPERFVRKYVLKTINIFSFKCISEMKNIPDHIPKKTKNIAPQICADLPLYSLIARLLDAGYFICFVNAPISPRNAIQEEIKDRIIKKKYSMGIV